MLPVLSRAIGEFQGALEKIGIADKVTTLTASDFGRTLSSNGRGSDHAWGGNHLVLGGSVAGGDIYGAYPELYSGNPLAAQVMAICSPARDNSTCSTGAVTMGPFIATDYDQDIIWADGFFVRYPAGTRLD